MCPPHSSVSQSVSQSFNWSHSLSPQNSSGVVGRLQRCSEQLVLYAKAVTLLESGQRQYQIELAASNIEPEEKLKTGKAKGLVDM